jgi:ORF6N domain-containing protein
MTDERSHISAEVIEQRIFLIRGQKVMLDYDLAKLYGVRTKILNQAIKRNRRRVPDDFMFQLTYQEVRNLRSQFVTSNKERGGRRYLSFAFTEQGVAMLSSVLNSECAVQVNIEIMRAFVRLRQLIGPIKISRAASTNSRRSTTRSSRSSSMRSVSS